MPQRQFSQKARGKLQRSPPSIYAGSHSSQVIEQWGGVDTLFPGGPGGKSKSLLFLLSSPPLLATEKNHTVLLLQNLPYSNSLQVFGLRDNSTLPL